MPRIKKFSPKLNLESYETFITDQDSDSFYFKITEFKETLTGGKNGFLIEGSEYLKESTDLQIEILDVNGDPVFHQPGEGIPEYYEGISKLVAVNVYEDTPIGSARITIFGELETYIDENGEIAEIPDQWKGTYNVKWTRTFKINKRLPNEDKVRFVKRPQINITELSGSLFSREIVRTSQSGSVRGIPFQPAGGTKLNTFSDSTFYKLKTTDGSTFNREMLRNGTIEVPNSGINQEISSLLSNTELIVREPFTINGLVDSFSASTYEINYDKLESSTESTILASFARFKIDRLKTFVGDVARMKVFSKPAFSIGEYEQIEDVRLESTELLTANVNGQFIPIGIFTSNFTDFWDVTSPGDYTLNQSNDEVFGGLKISDGNATNNPVTISTKESLNLTADTEYTFEFDVVYTGDITDKEQIRVYLQYTNENNITLQEDVIKFIPTNILKNQQNITKNVIAPIDSEDYKLVIEVNGEAWDIGNVSFRSADETAFSPDDIQLVFPVERELEVETFDFKFEFFDINNNYIPVDVFASHTFRQGNISVLDKFITVDVSQNAFQFNGEGDPIPENQVIDIRLKKNRIIGDLIITREVFDVTGSLLDSQDYDPDPYPGELIQISGSQGLEVYELPISNFTGSLHDDTIVSRIRYTVEEDPSASTAPEQTTFTIFRQDAGLTSKQVQVSADKNQFTYTRTTLEPTPEDQEIIIELTKSNIPDTNPTTINQVGNGPTLTAANPPTETELYLLTAGTGSLDYSATDGSTRYTFQVQGNDNVPYSGSVKISPVIIDEPLAVEMTKSTHTFSSLSTGVLTESISTGDVQIRLKVGQENISYNGTQQNNTWRVTSYTATGGTVKPLVVDPSSGFITIGLDSFTSDATSNAAVTIELTYTDGLGRTESIERNVNYTKSKDAKPTVLVSADPLTQSRSATPNGTLLEPLIDVTIRAREGDINIFDSMTVIDQSGWTPSHSFLITGSVLELSESSLDMIEDDATVTLQVTHTNSENVTNTTDLVVIVSKSKQGDPGEDGQPGAGGVSIDIVPPFQIVGTDSNGNPDDPEFFTVQIHESGTVFTYATGSLQPGEFRIQNVVSGSNNNNGTILPSTPPDLNGTRVTFDVIYNPLAGSGESNPISLLHDVEVIIEGSTGPGVVFTGVWEPARIYQRDETRRDVVLYSADGSPSSDFNTYYINNLTHTSTNDTDPDTGRPSPSSNVWTSLGTDDFFVAAKIAVFEESFIQNTLNVGTNNNGSLSSSNITLWGGDQYPYISLGQDNTLGGQGYGQNGIWIGLFNDGGSGVPRMSLTGVSGSLSWANEQLFVEGTVNALDGILQNLTITGQLDVGSTNPGVLIGEGVSIQDSTNINTYTDPSSSFSSDDGTYNFSIPIQEQFSYVTVEFETSPTNVSIPFGQTYSLSYTVTLQGQDISNNWIDLKHISAGGVEAVILEEITTTADYQAMRIQVVITTSSNASYQDGFEYSLSVSEDRVISIINEAGIFTKLKGIVIPSFNFSKLLTSGGDQAGGTNYSAGDGINITSNVISADIGTGLSFSGNDIVVTNPFNPSGTYSGLRAQSTTKGDVGLGNVTNDLQVPAAGGTFTGDVTVPNLLFNNGIISSSGLTGTNVDHIWHNDTTNTWHFVSDGSVKQDGNSALKAGNVIFGSGDFSGNISIGTSSRQKPSTGIELYGSSSSMLFGVQDGNGRIQLKWNASNGTSETYLMSNEEAFFWDVNVTGSPVWEMKRAPQGTAGNPITWSTLLTLSSGGNLNALDGYNVNGSPFVDQSRNITAGTGNFSGVVTVGDASAGTHALNWNSADSRYTFTVDDATVGTSAVSFQPHADELHFKNGTEIVANVIKTGNIVEVRFDYQGSIGQDTYVTGGSYSDTGHPSGVNPHIELQYNTTRTNYIDMTGMITHLDTLYEPIGNYVPAAGGTFTGGVTFNALTDFQNTVSIFRNNVLRFHAVGNSDTASIDVTKAGSPPDQALAARIDFSNYGSWNRKNIDFIVGNHQNYTTPASYLAARIYATGHARFFSTSSFLNNMSVGGSHSAQHEIDIRGIRPSILLGDNEVNIEAGDVMGSLLFYNNDDSTSGGARVTGAIRLVGQDAFGRTRLEFCTGTTIGKPGYADPGNYTDGTIRRMYITMEGNAVFHENVTANDFILSSDRRHKSKIEDLYAIELHRQLKPKSYVKKGRNEFGFIAQDIQKVVPTMVNVTDEYLYLHSNDIIAMNTSAIQYIDNEVDQLKYRVGILEEQVLELGGKL